MSIDNLNVKMTIENSNNLKTKVEYFEKNIHLGIVLIPLYKLDLYHGSKNHILKYSLIQCF